MICDICNSEDTYIKKHEHNFTIKGQKITFKSERRFCKKCNNLVYDAILDNKASEEAISLYNKKYGIKKEDIIKLRNEYNLSQESFSKIIGCAKKTLISYEKGKSIPNDSYLIILKSLLAKPESILLFIDSNKDQFDKKELDKINNKIGRFISNNTKQLIYNEECALNEFNGYEELSKEKVFNIILFFSDKSIKKTKLLKEMFYSDFLYYKENCKSITGLEYSKLPLGPVPDQFEEILNMGAEENIIDYEITLENEYECHNITSKKEFDSSIFNPEELKILSIVKEKFINNTSKEVVDFTHQETAYTKTNSYQKISYDYAFDIEF